MITCNSDKCLSSIPFRFVRYIFSFGQATEMPPAKQRYVFLVLLFVEICFPLYNARKYSSENAYSIESLKQGGGMFPMII